MKEKLFRFIDLIQKKKERTLGNLEQEVLRKLQTLPSRQNTGEAAGFRGTMIGFNEKLVDDGGRKYECTVVADTQRLEITVVDLCPTDDLPIRKYRVFLGKFEINGETTTYDLSCLGDKSFSWRRNTADHDYPEKGLTLKQSCQFMKDILRAHPEPPQDTPSIPLLK